MNSLSVHRLFLTALMVATKYHDDTFLSNKHWSIMGGVSQKEMNVLETEFLFLIDFNLQTGTLHSLLGHCVF